MGAGRIVLIGLRVIALLGTLVVIGLSVWCKTTRIRKICANANACTAKFVEHDIEMRGSAVLQRLKPEELVAQEWREFFVQATSGTTRIWITIVAVRIGFPFRLRQSILTLPGFCHIPYKPRCLFRQHHPTFRNAQLHRRPH
jgi:hypothetical protein